MCQIIDILDGREIETVKQLEEYLGEENVILLRGYSGVHNKEICLCPVDIEKTFKRVGKRLVKSPWGYEEKI